MNKWLIGILGVSLLFLGILKSHQVVSLSLVFKADRSIKLKNFHEAQKVVSKKDLHLLKLWESILTGRSAPVARQMKESYKTLGLNHIFTPSGFHLSAALLPFMKVLKTPLQQLVCLILIGAGISILPGLGALKRMILIKSTQKIIGLRIGFVAALIIDMFWGTFQDQALSFTYSMLFLGIIYSGLRGLKLMIWFFIAQIILAYFQDNAVSILILIFSPFLNLIFAILMPALVILSFPLNEWQLKTGLFFLRNIQILIEKCASICLSMPSLEVNIWLLMILTAIVLKRARLVLVGVSLFCCSLNQDLENYPAISSIFIPRGEHRETKYAEKYVTVYFSDGRCRMRLVRGYWFESCYPSRRKSSSLMKKIS